MCWFRLRTCPKIPRLPTSASLWLNWAFGFDHGGAEVGRHGIFGHVLRRDVPGNMALSVWDKLTKGFQPNIRLHRLASGKRQRE